MSAAAFLVDECLPIDVTVAFRQRGLDVADLVERGLRGLDDRAVWALGAAESRILVTSDSKSTCSLQQCDLHNRGVIPLVGGMGGPHAAKNAANLCLAPWNRCGRRVIGAFWSWLGVCSPA